MARRVKRHGFTLIELMVVIAIIALLATMSFRGITKARETARKLRCSQQMRDIATAMNQYEIDRRVYPGYRNVLLMTNNASFTNPNNPGQGGVSWAIPVLPYLDYTAVYDALRTPATGSPGASGGGGGAGGSGGGGASGPIVSANYAQITIENFSCPSDPPSTAGGTPLAYVVNSGCIDSQGTPRTSTTAGVPRDWPANGVFFDRFTGNPTASYTGSGGGSSSGNANQIPQVQQSNSWIGQRDGLVQTVMLLENVDHGQYMDVLEPALGCIWDISAQVNGSQQVQPGSPPPTCNPTQPTYRINAQKGVGASTQAGSLFTASSGGGSTQQYMYTRPSSMHIGGVNVAYCDGHVGFLNEQMEYFVYCLLMSADGKNVKQPGQQTPLANNWFKLPVDDAWINP